MIRVLLVLYLSLLSLAVLSESSVLLSNSSTFAESGSFTHLHLEELKTRTRKLFDHGWNSYMDHAYPADEVRPLSCTKYEKSDDVRDIHRNDVLGNYSVTFLDTITTFAVFGDIGSFEKYVEVLRGLKSFDIDSTVQVFETSIRALGSLLSAHLYAGDKFKLPSYDGFLLRLAEDLGERLMCAYGTSSGIPVARVNLHNAKLQLPTDLVGETCTAGAASPMLEMTLLSILTNNTKFEEASRTAFLTLWSSRSKIDLVPMSVNPLEGKWLNAMTGVGASIDSFYEYALKGSILFDDDELQEIWSRSYRALSTHSQQGWFLGNVNVDTGVQMTPWIDSLSAFFPGLLVLAGKVHEAVLLHRPFIKLWNKYNGIPERWDYASIIPKGGQTVADPISLEWYPLRPEFIESTYYLYRATKDPIYLRVGEAILHDYETFFLAPCGFAGFRDVRTRELQDRMESFVLSETFMYLYLLFDENNELNRDDDFVFSTEGHPLWVPRGVLKHYNVHKREFLASTTNAAATSTSDDPGQTTTMAAILEKIKSWPRQEIANAASYIKGLFDDEVENSDAYASELSVLSLEKLWLSSIGYDLAPIDEADCPVWAGTDGLFSAYLADPKVFVIDSIFQKQYKDSRLELEVSPNFYSTYVPPNSFCERRPTTATVDYHFGDMSVRDRHTPLLEYIIPSSGPVSSASDIWVHDLNALRIVFEILVPGQIGVDNLDVERSYVDSFYENVTYDVHGACPADSSDVGHAKVFKARTINGISVAEGANVYVSPSNKNKGLIGTGVVKTTDEGYLVVSDIVVTNMVLWRL